MDSITGSWAASATSRSSRSAWPKTTSTGFSTSSRTTRGRKIRGYQRELELDEQEGKIARAENLTPLERTYLDALSYAQSEPEKCAVKLQAVIDLFASQSDSSLPSGNCIELARRHLKQLRQEMAAHAAEQLPFLLLRLDRADVLKSTDPKRAAAMYRAVIELYSAKSWAAPAIEAAKAALAKARKRRGGRGREYDESRGR